MKTKSNLKTITALGLSVVLGAGALHAAPTEELDGGTTRVTLSETLVNALTTLQVNLGDISPGRVKRGNATFPVESGALDLGTLAGEIVHEGGLKLSNATTEVRLIDFVIDTTNPEIVLTGLVIANDSVVGRIPLFKVDLTAEAVATKRAVKINDVVLTLSSEAAAALNSVFGVTAFAENLPVGTAVVDAKLD